MAKRHLKRPETRRAMWQRLVAQGDEDPIDPKPGRRRKTGKQPPKIEGRTSAEPQEVTDQPETSNSTVCLIDLFGRISSLLVTDGRMLSGVHPPLRG